MILTYNARQIYLSSHHLKDETLAILLRCRYLFKSSAFSKDKTPANFWSCPSLFKSKWFWRSARLIYLSSHHFETQSARHLFTVPVFIQKLITFERQNARHFYRVHFCSNPDDFDRQRPPNLFKLSSFWNTKRPANFLQCPFLFRSSSFSKDKTPANFLSSPAKSYRCPFDLNAHHIWRQDARQFLPVSVLFKLSSSWSKALANLLRCPFLFKRSSFLKEKTPALGHHFGFIKGVTIAKCWLRSWIY